MYIKRILEGSAPAIARADLKKPWKAIRRHAQLEGVRLHDLRHTFASIGAGASLGLPVAGRLFGHFSQMPMPPRGVDESLRTVKWAQTWSTDGLEGFGRALF